MNRRSLFQLLFGGIAARWWPKKPEVRVISYGSWSDGEWKPQFIEWSEQHVIDAWNAAHKDDQWRVEDFQPGGKHYAYQSADGVRSLEIRRRFISWNA